MIRPGLCVVALLLAGSMARAQEPPAGALSCSGCHANSASVQTPVPHLIGRPAEEIEEAMAAFRSGKREATVMDRIAKGFTDDDVKAIAEWYANLKPRGAADAR